MFSVDSSLEEENRTDLLKEREKGAESSLQEATAWGGMLVQSADEGSGVKSF
jgi:hypothetical protein